MSATPTIGPELRSVLKQLRLGQILEALPERILLAEKQSLSFEDLLLMVLGDEVARRDSSAAARRARGAGLDPDMVLERWDKSAAISYDKRLFAELASYALSMRIVMSWCSGRSVPAKPSWPRRSGTWRASTAITCSSSAPTS